MGSDFASVGNGGVQVLDGLSEPVVDNPTGLDPCLNCGRHPHDAPEGVHGFQSARQAGVEPGSPRWSGVHCWYCGFRPGVNAVVDQSKLYEQFKKWYEDRTSEILKHATTNADMAAKDAAYQDRITKMEAQLAALTKDSDTDAQSS